jgi:hypothetical protein
MFLKSMTVAKLQDLKRQVEAAIDARIKDRRHEIEAQLSKLSHFDTGPTNGVTAHVKKRVALKTGKRLHEALTTDGPKASMPKRPRKSVKAKRKARKPENIGQVSPLTPTDAQHTEALPIEPPSAAPISANDIPVNLGAAA